MRARWTSAAREQLVRAFEYIAADNQAARRTVDKIWRSTELLAKHPMVGREGRVGGTREFVVRGTPFIVAYRVGRTEVEILAILHAARKWPNEF